MQSYVVLHKPVGATPLQCLEAYRATTPTLKDVPMTYAGRLDPMASGTLLVLIGEECKQQARYRNLDKQYTVSVLFGAHSDSGDVLGIIDQASPPTTTSWGSILRSLTGSITLPYPHYSSRTIAGVPLHTWAVMGKIDEVSIPDKTPTIYQLAISGVHTMTRAQVVTYAQEKIALLPPVTEERKALGNDFRRPDVLASWKVFATTGTPADSFTILDITCTCSSGTYMRSLADEIGKRACSRGLALAITRTTIGRYQPLVGNFGWWTKWYR